MPVCSGGETEAGVSLQKEGSFCDEKNSDKICAEPDGTYACGEFEDGVICVFDIKT